MFVIPVELQIRVFGLQELRTVLLCTYYFHDFLYGFNSTTDWVPGSGFDNDGSRLSCWLRNPTVLMADKGTLGVADDSTGTAGTGPSAGRGGFVNTFVLKPQVLQTKAVQKLLPCSLT